MGNLYRNKLRMHTNCRRRRKIISFNYNSHIRAFEMFFFITSFFYIKLKKKTNSVQLYCLCTRLLSIDCFDVEELTISDFMHARYSQTLQFISIFFFFFLFNAHTKMIEMGAKNSYNQINVLRISDRWKSLY